MRSVALAPRGQSNARRDDGGYHRRGRSRGCNSEVRQIPTKALSAAHRI